MAKINKKVDVAKQNELRMNVQNILGIGNFNPMSCSEYPVYYNNQLNKENDTKSSGVYNHDILY